MAAISESPLPHVVELRHVRSSDLNALLEEETRTWERKLDWDFRPSAGLVRRFVDVQALTGFSLLINGQIAGYSYFVCEERKGLIGDLYVMDNFASPENEAALLSAVLDSLLKTAFVRRVESQLMMLRHGARMALPYRRYVQIHNRDFMELALENTERFTIGKAAEDVI